jgi:hypothetical protein
MHLASTLPTSTLCITSRTLDGAGGAAGSAGLVIVGHASTALGAAAVVGVDKDGGGVHNELAGLLKVGICGCRCDVEVFVRY